MVRKYSFLERELPNLPTPHDQVIESIRADGDWIVFEFADRPGIESIGLRSMRFHLIDDEFELYAFERRKYEEAYVRRKPKKLFELPKGERELEYLYHFVRYGEIIIELCAMQGYMLRMCVDIVETEC